MPTELQTPYAQKVTQACMRNPRLALAILTQLRAEDRKNATTRIIHAQP